MISTLAKAVPSVQNAGTTYGVDTSSQNNYGLGPGFSSTLTKAHRQRGSSAASQSNLLFYAVVIIVGVLLFL